MSRRLPDEFTPPALVARILRGASDADDVRLHGAIVAAINLHGMSAAKRDVFAPALDAARKRDQRCYTAVASAIRQHAANPTG